MASTMNAVCTQKTGFRRKLLSERIHYRAPFCSVIMAARIKGAVPREDLARAINKAALMHPLLGTGIAIEGDGSAWFVPGEFKELPLEIKEKKNDMQWMEKAIAEYKKPFALDKGPLIRFILLDSQQSSDLLVMCHHAICDGISLVYLIRDILSFLAEPDKEAEPLPIPPVLDLSCLTGPVRIGLLPKLVLGHFSRAWKKRMKVFGEEDYAKIYRSFWDREKLNIIIHSMRQGMSSSLADRCRKEGVTVNSAVCTAFEAAQHTVQKDIRHFKRTGIAVNLRNRMSESPGEGMGLFAGGNSVRLEYVPGKPFWDMAREFDRKVKKLLSGGYKLYEILLFNSMEQTLIDAVYFHLFGGFENKTAASFAKLLHFDRKIPGLGVTNLGKVHIPEIYGPYVLESLFFVPPNIPGGEKVLGVVTAGGIMNISLVSLESHLDPHTAQKVMDCAVAYLENAVSAGGP